MTTEGIDQHNKQFFSNFPTLFRQKIKTNKQNPHFIVCIDASTKYYLTQILAKWQLAFLKENFDEFWSKEMWPPSSPDANPMDYSVQSILETKVCHKNYSSVPTLTKALKREWNKISADEIRKICASAPKRLKAIADKVGGHVE